MINIYCTYDNVSEEYSIPWFAKNDNVAKRNLKIASRREALPLSDIFLYRIGSYDQDLGEVKTFAPISVILEEEKSTE